MDPQLRILLEQTWAALRGAGAALARPPGARTGVYVGCMYQEYTQLQPGAQGRAERRDRQRPELHGRPAELRVRPDWAERVHGHRVLVLARGHASGAQGAPPVLPVPGLAGWQACTDTACLTRSVQLAAAVG